MPDPTIAFLDAATVTRFSPMPQLIEALRSAFGGGYHAPPRAAHDLAPGVSLLVMPAWNEATRLGVKIVTVDRDARPAIRASYLLIDRTSGAPLALLDGAALTRRRTAAASVLAAGYLARRDARRLLVLGTGALVAPLVEAYAGAFTLDDVAIWGRDMAKAEAAAAQARHRGAPARSVARIADALPDADIVSAATLATDPLIAGDALRAGMHVDLIGAFRPEMCEADGRAFARAQVFVDTREGALDEAGDLLQAIAARHIAAADIRGDLAALCAGRHPGRGGDREAITLFKSVGTGLEDLAAAELVYTSWRDAGASAARR
jgi:ornithine cyclodeaminase